MNEAGPLDHVRHQALYISWPQKGRAYQLTVCQIFGFHGFFSVPDGGALLFAAFSTICAFFLATQYACLYTD